MKNRIMLSEKEILDILRRILPQYGYEVDDDVACPLKVDFGQTPHSGQPPTVSKLKLSLNIRADVPLLPGGVYRKCVPLDLISLREYLFQGLVRRAIFPEVIGFEVRYIFGRLYFAAEYVA